MISTINLQPQFLNLKFRYLLALLGHEHIYILKFLPYTWFVIWMSLTLILWGFRKGCQVAIQNTMLFASRKSQKARRVQINDQYGVTHFEVVNYNPKKNWGEI